MAASTVAKPIPAIKPPGGPPVSIDATGQPVHVPAPGIYDSVPIENYAAWPAVSGSSYKSAAVSMLQFNYDWMRPIDPTPAMVFGSACHMAIMEPDDILRRVVLWEGGENKSGEFTLDKTKCPKAWAAFKDKHGGKLILDSDKYDAVLAVRNAVRRHQLARKYFGGDIRVEQSIVWTDPASGVVCKSRPDVIGESIVQFKTTTNGIDDRAVRIQTSKLGYHVQSAAHVCGVFATMQEIKNVVMVWVEQNPPHDVAVYRIPDWIASHAEAKWLDMLGRIATCRETGRWPGLSDQILELPKPFDMTEDAETITLGGQPLEV